MRVRSFQFFGEMKRPPALWSGRASCLLMLIVDSPTQSHVRPRPSESRAPVNNASFTRFSTLEPVAAFRRAVACISSSGRISSCSLRGSSHRAAGFVGYSPGLPPFPAPYTAPCRPDDGSRGQTAAEAVYKHLYHVRTQSGKPHGPHCGLNVLSDIEGIHAHGVWLDPPPYSAARIQPLAHRHFLRRGISSVIDGHHGRLHLLSHFLLCPACERPLHLLAGAWIASGGHTGLPIRYRAFRCGSLSFSGSCPLPALLFLP